MKISKLIITFVITALLTIIMVLLLSSSLYLDEDRKQKVVDLDDTIKISYVGDLILLKDQVVYSKTGDSYDFDYMFKYAKKYFEDSDYSIGVFEGPSTDNYKYSTSNYADGNKLYLNFPEAFIKSVKNSGIDFVTTANNHMLDMGYEAAMETLDNLEESGVEYTGTYRNKEEYNSTKIIEIDGVKIAVLSYAYGSNYINKNYFFEENKYFTKIIVSKTNKYFEQSKDIVLKDIKRAKKSEADLIVVMAHMGTQFIHTANDMQNTWNKIFAENGVDIVLGDHSHATQPVEWINDTLVVNSPGNFANSYIKNDGDATSIVNIYIDKDSKTVVTSSVIPMYTWEKDENKFTALPIYEIFTNDVIYESLTKKELARAKEVLGIITESMVGTKANVNSLQKEYFIHKNATELSLDDSIKNSKFYEALLNANSITFIGDSITEGTKNDYHPWYEAISNTLSSKNISNISKGSLTIKNLYNKKENEIKKVDSDVVVIAIGCNDIRYRSKTSALTSDEYVVYMNKIINMIKKNNKETKFFVLAPWPSLDYDRLSKENLINKTKLYEEYILALKNKYKKSKNVVFINQYEYLTDFFEENNAYEYLIDQIHPNDNKGIVLYSKSVLESY